MSIFVEQELEVEDETEEEEDVEATLSLVSSSYLHHHLLHRLLPYALFGRCIHG